MSQLAMAANNLKNRFRNTRSKLDLPFRKVCHEQPENRTVRILGKARNIRGLGGRVVHIIRR